ncbi:hypothetical protein B296_00015032 [Ensete ventricosum]|uniref:Uncharacterized protein n=1 Tax=Ensete ventricosum TaxID=4639 RepID=A0A427A858_ENSVE|nr:hypothetical protein B296_00015032 [Ensete ventricosum]
MDRAGGPIKSSVLSPRMGEGIAHGPNRVGDPRATNRASDLQATDRAARGIFLLFSFFSLFSFFLFLPQSTADGRLRRYRPIASDLRTGQLVDWYVLLGTGGSAVGLGGSTAESTQNPGPG